MTDCEWREDTLACRHCGFVAAHARVRRNCPARLGVVTLPPQNSFHVAGGPGTELSKLLKRFGIEPTPTCACRAKAAQMDAWGCEECSKPERIEEVVAVMRAEAEVRGLPFVDIAARLLVKRAISNARRKEAAANAQRPPHHDRGEKMAPQVHDAQG